MKTPEYDVCAAEYMDLFLRIFLEITKLDVQDIERYLVVDRLIWNSTKRRR